MDFVFDCIANMIHLVIVNNDENSDVLSIDGGFINDDDTVSLCTQPSFCDGNHSGVSNEVAVGQLDHRGWLVVIHHHVILDDDDNNNASSIGEDEMTR